ncbi:FAD:protein FMN transferase [Zavarzinia sp. CC-PAN008]|uniref:FAD:protein FMN transferase n=1 Tax=Zavarzinia sp. CC-PAN008 TaxID=3243332 RepID=UPI003F74A470
MATLAAARRVLVPRAVAVTRPPAGRIVALEGLTMGTTWRVQAVVAPGPALDLRATVERALARVIAQMSTWDPASDLARFNASAPGHWQGFAAETWTVLDAALAVAAASDGAYDPTLGHLVDLWGFGPAGPVPAAPTPAQLATARAGSGWRLLEQRYAPRQLRQPGGLALDLSAIAKGFAVDLVAQALDALGLVHHLVEIGGELRGTGCKPDGQPWWVALEPPVAGGGGLVPTLIALHGLAVATSGDYRRQAHLDGQTGHHLLDPRNGRPTGNGLASVSVLHPSCMVADAWATALAVLGPEAGLRLATEQGLAALLTSRRGDGLHQVPSPACAALMA